MKPTAPRRARKMWADPTDFADTESSFHACVPKYWAKGKMIEVLCLRWDKASRDALEERVAQVLTDATVHSKHTNDIAKAAVAALPEV